MRYYIITYGCQMNLSDSERLAQLLASRGYQPAKNEEQADLIVVNMCSVRQSAVDRAYHKIKNLKNKKNSKVVLTGCILETDKKKFEELGIEIKKFRQLPLVFSCHSGLDPESKANKEPWTLNQVQDGPKKNLSRYQKAYIPIMSGCNNFCTFCVVPYTRGREWSRPVEEILKDVHTLVKQGYQEIVLLGQNVNSYNNRKDRSRACPPAPKSEGRTLKNRQPQEPAPYLLRGSPLQEIIDFADLLKVINSLPGDFKIRFLTNHPKDISDKLIRTISQCDKVIKEIHLPFQAGDNEILKKMNRGYSRQQYLSLVKKIKDTIPDVKLTTDIIVGFPGETKKQFQQTVFVVKKVGFRQAYIAKYSPRPGTGAYRLKDDVAPAEKKRRERILRKFIKTGN